MQRREFFKAAAASLVAAKIAPAEAFALPPVSHGPFTAAPIVFDDKIITSAVLHGELKPLVKVVKIDRQGRPK